MISEFDSKILGLTILSMKTGRTTTNNNNNNNNDNNDNNNNDNSDTIHGKNDGIIMVPL